MTAKMSRAPDSSMKTRPKNVETMVSFHDAEIMTADNLTQGVNLQRGHAQVLQGRFKNCLSPPTIDYETGEVLTMETPKSAKAKS